ncbi:hypothetical protein CYMTET_54043 [Cymbomonas tetramitiformis]|uniref:Retrotransposon gag domain-containing protein n=1 Tax=Cymbomonas tetramitiformis TaxID=36881 RepID=A0AAE0EPS0_9CHLO|nr:hypothetical protein CYMTET_54043 [Cymbomonas tetramitiformis]
MSRYRDPETEPKEPDEDYSEDNPPPAFTDPDDGQATAALIPAAIVPKVKMNPPKEYKVGQDAEVWMETVDRYFQFTYPGAPDKDLITVFLTFIQNNDRHYFHVVAKTPDATYEDVMNTFLRQFGNPHKRSVAKKHLMALQQGNQTFADYLRTFTSLTSLASVDLDDVLIKDIFVSNMESDLRKQFNLRFLTEDERNNLKVLLDLNYVVHSKQAETLHYRGQKEQSGGPARKDKDKGRGNTPYDRANQNQGNQNQNANHNSQKNKGKGKGKRKGKGSASSPSQPCQRRGRTNHVTKDCFSTKTPEGKPIKGNPPAQNPYKGQQQQNNQGGKSESNKLLKTVNTLVKELQNQQSINAAVAAPAPAPASAPAPQGNSPGTGQVPVMRAARG